VVHVLPVSTERPQITPARTVTPNVQLVLLLLIVLVNLVLLVISYTEQLVEHPAQKAFGKMQQIILVKHVMLLVKFVQEQLILAQHVM
jgi:hypothetical protein